MAEEECAGQGSFFLFFLKDVYTLAADEIDLEEGGELLIQKKGQTTAPVDFLGRDEISN